MPFAGYREQLPCSFLKPRAKTPSKNPGSLCAAFLLLVPHRLGDQRALGRLNARVPMPIYPGESIPSTRERIRTVQERSGKCPPSLRSSCGNLQNVAC